MSFSRYRVHIITTCIVAATISICYGTYNSAMSIKKWTRAPSRQMHDEMEFYLYQKQLDAMKKQTQ